MANDCDNYLKVTGPTKDTLEFRQFAASSDQDLFDIMKFVPVPEEIREEKPPGNNLESEQKLLEKYGAKDRHDWACNNWGNKSGAYDTSVTESMNPQSQESSLRYHFLTAWAPFTDECMAAVSERFPSLKFQLRYSEPGLGFHGHSVVQDGQVLESHTEDMVDSNEGANQ